MNILPPNGILEPKARWLLNSPFNAGIPSYYDHSCLFLPKWAGWVRVCGVKERDGDRWGGGGGD